MLQTNAYKAANSTNLTKHPKENHADFYKDFLEVGDSSLLNIIEVYKQVGPVNDMLITVVGLRVICNSQSCAKLHQKFQFQDISILHAVVLTKLFTSIVI